MFAAFDFLEMIQKKHPKLYFCFEPYANILDKFGGKNQWGNRRNVAHNSNTFTLFLSLSLMGQHSMQKSVKKRVIKFEKFDLVNVHTAPVDLYAFLESLAPQSIFKGIQVLQHFTSKLSAGVNQFQIAWSGLTKTFINSTASRSLSEDLHCRWPKGLKLFHFFFQNFSY